MDRADLELPFAFDRRYEHLLGVVGVNRRTSGVRISDHVLVVRFGPWVVETPLTNVADACLTGPYRAWRAIGVRLSLADRGLTFGTTCEGGVCIRFHQPVTGIDPLGLLHHPGLTVTVADREGLRDELVRLTGRAPRG